MIRGIVNDRREAVIRLRVRGSTGIEQGVDAIIDSGFTGAITLPLTIVSLLRLAAQTSSRAALANGVVQRFDRYAAEVEWDGTWRPAVV